MARLLLTRRWLWRHLLVLAAMTVCVLLGRWQWDKAHSAIGGVQNWAYAIQWWVFATFPVFLWVKELREEARPGADRPSSEAAVPKSRTPSPPPVDDDEDPELAAYNRYLAWLHGQDEQRR